MTWSVPHSIAASREDVDKEGRLCVVYDAVFHPEALRLGGSNDSFKEMLTTTAMDAIERQFTHHKLDRDTCKYPKMTFKGMPSRTVIRTRKDGSQADSKPPSMADTLGRAAQAMTKSSNARPTPLKATPAMSDSTAR